MTCPKDRFCAEFFYPYPESTGYTPEEDFRRFTKNFMKASISGKVLDIGCGTGTLLSPEFGIAANIQSYTGVEYRQETLELVRKTYPEFAFLPEIPSSGEYDSIVMLGTCKFNINRNFSANKVLFADRLQRAWKLIKSGSLIFSVNKDVEVGDYDDPLLVKYSRNELETLIDALPGVRTSQIVPDYVLGEYYVICRK